MKPAFDRRIGRLTERESSYKMFDKWEGMI